MFLLEGREGGVLIPFPRKLFFPNPSSNPTIPACVAQIEIPFPFFHCFFFHESQSQCSKSHFPASKKGKSQLPFYPFTTLLLEGTDHRGWFKRGVYKRGVHIRKKKKVTANPSPQLSWFHANKILERDLRKGFCKRRSGRVARDTLWACHWLLTPKLKRYC